MESRVAPGRDYHFTSRSSLIRVLLIFLAISLFFFTSARAELQVESSKDVGFGFRVVMKSGVSDPHAFEVGHFAFLYYKDIELSQYNTYSIAPSGKYALFQDPTGALTLFAAATAQRKMVARSRPSRVEQYVWHEGNGYVVVDYENESSLRIALPAR